ncbi:hypothetical protein G7046_g6104 [Stylonectria norvegica]|nr:hypothetical protein G7046_g6104 [Stylonectria norvegica]
MESKCVLELFLVANSSAENLTDAKIFRQGLQVAYHDDVFGNDPYQYQSSNLQPAASPAGYRGGKCVQGSARALPSRERFAGDGRNRVQMDEYTIWEHRGHQAVLNSRSRLITSPKSMNMKVPNGMSSLPRTPLASRESCKVALARPQATEDITITGVHLPKGTVMVWDYVICNEAQNVKKSKGAFHYMLRGMKVNHLIWMTGSPLVLSLRDLLSALSLMWTYLGLVWEPPVSQFADVAHLIYSDNYDPYKENKRTPAQLTTSQMSQAQLTST